MQPFPTRAVENRRDSRGAEQAGIGPERHADDLRVTGAAANDLDERRVGRELERRSRDAEPSVAGYVAEQFAHLLLDLRQRFARDRPPLAREQARRGVARVLLAALDQRRVHRPSSEQRMADARAQPRGQRVEAHENRPHPRDRVDTEVGP